MEDKTPWKMKTEYLENQVSEVGPKQNIARIAKAALHKLPGKSSLNVDFVYLDCPICPASTVLSILSILSILSVLSIDQKSLS